MSLPPDLAALMDAARTRKWTVHFERPETGPNRFSFNDEPRARRFMAKLAGEGVGSRLEAPSAAR